MLPEHPRGSILPAGMTYSIVRPSIDFETYSEAGFIWDELQQRFVAPRGSDKKGLQVVGAGVYAEHPSAEVLSLAYDLKDGAGGLLWIPGMSEPTALFDYIASGGLIEAWNCAFEYWIWSRICVKKYGWPELPQSQLRDAMAKSRAFGLPGSLADAGRVLGIQNQKDKDGTRLLKKFSIPRNPTKNNARTRITPSEDNDDAMNLYRYNLQDIKAEAEISRQIPDLSASELEFWLVDQRINQRGVQIDRECILACMSIIDQAHIKYNQELTRITNGQVKYASEVTRLKNWINGRRIKVDSLAAEALDELLKRPLAPDIHRALTIRKLIGSAAVAKLYAMNNTATLSNRLHDLFAYHAARTGRVAGRGAQPQNFPNSGMEVLQCGYCYKHFRELQACPWCGNDNTNPDFINKFVEWNPQAVEDCIQTIKSGSLECVEMFWGDATAAISGCLRGLFVAAPNKDLICSDYNAIEAVVLAMLADEKWRIEVFRTHGKIYEMSASTLTGIPFEKLLMYKATTGQHHPSRKTFGKVSELGSGFGGWIGAWKNFGAGEFLNDDEIKKAILAWRAASPNIVEFWGGQERRWVPEFYGLEGMAVLAVQNPGNEYNHRGICYLVRNDVLYCRLLSGRYIVYHKPRLRPSSRRPGTVSLSFEGWNTNPKYGAIGWVRMDTYSAKLCENVVQATARDILAHAIVQLEKAGYPVVLHVHDEIVCEIPEGFGSLEEFERVMSTMPDWAADWPVKASGGWRAKRYAK